MITEPVGPSQFGTGTSNSVSTSHRRSSPPNTHREVPQESLSRDNPQDVTSNEIDMRVERAVHARNERKGLEKNLRQSQKAFNKRFGMTSEDTVHSSGQQVSNETSHVEQAATENQVQNVMKNLDPADFAKEPIAVDPRNFMKADSPIYDRLENVLNDSGDGERGVSSQTSSSIPLSTGLTGSHSTVPEIVATLSPPESSSSGQPRFSSPPLDLGDVSVFFAWTRLCVCVCVYLCTYVLTHFCCLLADPSRSDGD